MTHYSVSQGTTLCLVEFDDDDYTSTDKLHRVTCPECAVNIAAEVLGAVNHLGLAHLARTINRRLELQAEGSRP